MEREHIKIVVDGIMREIVAEVDNGKSHVEFYEGEELQLIIDIPEDVINLENAKFKKRKYAYIFDYFLYVGIQDLKYEDICYTISTNCIKCKAEFVFHNKNGVEFTKRGYSFSYLAVCEKEINHVKFRFTKDINNYTYRQLTELKQDNSWKMLIANMPYRNEHNEDCVKIWANGLQYTMLRSIYDRINSDDYLNARNFFQEGSTLFDITKEQNRLLAKSNILRRQQNFIKYIDFDGTVVV